MSILTSNPARANQRAQVVTEAVVSAYLREITRRQRPRQCADARRTCSPSPRAIARTPLRAPARSRAPAPRRGALALGA
jgi:hypothetical protein